MAILLAFSGACNSGKTTSIKLVAEALQKSKCNVKIVHELIRTYTTEPIDEVRKDANKYLDLQIKIISEKIKQEAYTFEDKSNTVYLIDRALTDSLVYFENYIDKGQLDSEHTKKFYDFHKYVDTLLKTRKRYNRIFCFSPLPITAKDKYRQDSLYLSQHYEHSCIERLNTLYFPLLSFAITTG